MVNILMSLCRRTKKKNCHFARWNETLTRCAVTPGIKEQRVSGKKNKKKHGGVKKKSVTAGDWRCKKAGVCARQHFSLFQKRNKDFAAFFFSINDVLRQKKDANDRQWMLVCSLISTPSETHGLSRVLSRKHRNLSKSSSDDWSKRKNTFFIKMTACSVFF